MGSCELLSLLPAPEPAFDLTSLPGDGFDGNTDGLESRPSDGEEQDWMQVAVRACGGSDENEEASRRGSASAVRMAPSAAQEGQRRGGH